jgi:hypothetical protein
MTRCVAAALLFSLVLAGSASAQNCTVPNTLTNGTNADATQVMANFAAILTCLNNPVTQAAPRSYLAGLTLSTAGSSANFGVTVGVATSDDATVSMTLPTSYAKTTGAWAVGSGNGSLDTGTIANNTWYHVFLIERTDTGVVDVLISLSATAPTLPTSYTKQRRIGSMKTDGSARWTSFVQVGDEFLWATSAADASGLAVSTTPSSVALTVPTGVIVWAKFTALSAAGSSMYAYFYSLDRGAQASGTSPLNASLANIGASDQSSGDFTIRTNTSRQIGAVSSVSSNAIYIGTYGWIDTRGRNN